MFWNKPKYDWKTVAKKYKYKHESSKRNSIAWRNSWKDLNNECESLKQEKQKLLKDKADTILKYNELSNKLEEALDKLNWKADK